MAGPRCRAMGMVAVMAACGSLLSACGATEPGLTIAGPDHRSAVSLSPDKVRDLKRGMRIYLESVQGIIDGAARRDMRQVAKSAERSGTGMVSGVSLTDAFQLPAEFVGMALDTHQRFDDLARAARTGANKSQVLGQLDGILANCTACHASYRLGR